jgi:hypothetical protein
MAFSFAGSLADWGATWFDLAQTDQGALLIEAM